MGIKSSIQNTVIGCLPQRIRSFIHFTESQRIESNKFINISYSQEGEDLLLNRLIGEKKNGFYVDVGAHHPFRFSNTYKFYLQGWSGINIDPLPESMVKFRKSRSRDINLEIPILNNPEKEMTYFMFNEPALNTFNEIAALELEKKSDYYIVNKILIKPQRLQEVLDKYLPENLSIDFLSVDVEGMDLDVLKSNNWSKYRPTYIIVESISTDLKEDLGSPLTKFLHEKKYKLIGKTVNSLFFSNNFI